MGKSRIYSKPMLTERLPDGKRKIMRDIVGNCGWFLHTVPAGFVTDFSSIPEAVHGIVRWSKVDYAGVFHDSLYANPVACVKGKTINLTRKQCDDVWLLFALSGEHRANKAQAYTCYYTLRACAWVVWNKKRRNKE